MVSATPRSRPTQCRGGLHGIQLWVAQPEADPVGAPAFEHHPVLPEVEWARPGPPSWWACGREPAHRPGGTPPWSAPSSGWGRGACATSPLDAVFEHALVVLDGAVTLDGPDRDAGPPGLPRIRTRRVGLTTSAEARLLLLGGEPFESPVVMWWNFVGRSRQEMADAARHWMAGSERFGETGSAMDRIPAPPIPWPDGSGP